MRYSYQSTAPEVIYDGNGDIIDSFIMRYPTESGEDKLRAAFNGYRRYIGNTSSGSFISYIPAVRYWISTSSVGWAYGGVMQIMFKDYGFEINGILGMTVLIVAGAISNLRTREFDLVSYTIPW